MVTYGSHRDSGKRLDDETENDRLLSQTNNAPSTEDEAEFRVGHELGSLLHLSLPSVAVQFSLYFLFPLTASVVGRKLGSEALAGFALGSLVGNLSCLSVIVGALSAADTLLPRAYGAGDYPEMGLLAIRGVLACTILLVPLVLLLCLALDRLLSNLGQDPVAVTLATDWIVPYYILGVPANMLFRVIQRFLVAQRRPWPPVYAGAFTSLCLHPWLVHCCVNQWGFRGSAVAISLSQWIMLAILLFYLRIKHVHHPETWSGKRRRCVRCG